MVIESGRVTFPTVAADAIDAMQTTNRPTINKRFTMLPPPLL
jgi:hypothetical protein